MTAKQAEKNKSAGREFVPFSLLLQGGEGKPQTIDPLLQCRKQAEEKLRQAEKALADALLQADEIKRAAHEKGHAEGYGKGEEVALVKYDEAIEQLGRTMEAVERQRAVVQQGYEKDLLPIIIAVADRLVHHEISVNRQVIVSCLKMAMQFVSDSAVIRVHLHPEDFARVREASFRNPDLLSGRKQLDLVEDETVSQGGCLLRSDFGEVDASFDKFRSRLFAAVEEAFLAALAENQT